VTGEELRPLLIAHLRRYPNPPRIPLERKVDLAVELLPLRGTAPIRTLAELLGISVHLTHSLLSYIRHVEGSLAHRRVCPRCGGLGLVDA